MQQTKKYQVYLLSYIAENNVSGRIFNYRTDNQLPSIEDIESIEKKIALGNRLASVAIIHVCRVADTDVLPQDFDKFNSTEQME